ncbi:unnamed protein product [Natator depressus]
MCAPYFHYKTITMKLKCIVPSREKYSTGWKDELDDPIGFFLTLMSECSLIPTSQLGSFSVNNQGSYSLFRILDHHQKKKTLFGTFQNFMGSRILSHIEFMRGGGTRSYLFPLGGQGKRSS